MVFVLLGGFVKKTILTCFLLLCFSALAIGEELKKGDCIKIRRSKPNAGVVFIVEKADADGIEIRGNYFVLDASRLDTKKISKKQLSYFEKVSCEGGI